MLVWLLGESRKGDHNWFLVGLTLGRICGGCRDHWDWLTYFGSVRIEPTVAKKNKNKSILVEIAPIFALSPQTPLKVPSWLNPFTRNSWQDLFSIIYFLPTFHPAQSYFTAVTSSISQKKDGSISSLYHPKR